MSNATGNGTVLWELDARGVATVTLNRPAVNNAYNGDLIEGVHAAMDALGVEQDLRAVVLRGNGKHFQAGADLAWIGSVGQMSAEENERVSRATAEVVRRLDTLPVPTVALVRRVQRRARREDERDTGDGAGPLLEENLRSLQRLPQKYLTACTQPRPCRSVSDAVEGSLPMRQAYITRTRKSRALDHDRPSPAPVR